MSIQLKVADIAHNLTRIYNELIDMSEDIEYRNIDGQESCAGDDLKYLMVNLMDEIQKLSPVDY